MKKVCFPNNVICTRVGGHYFGHGIGHREHYGLIRHCAYHFFGKKSGTGISDSFGGINLEDIAAPRCFEIERKLKEKLDIPVFHDDQHGTAVEVGAALINPPLSPRRKEFPFCSSRKYYSQSA